MNTTPSFTTSDNFALHTKKVVESILSEIQEIGDGYVDHTRGIALVKDGTEKPISTGLDKVGKINYNGAIYDVFLLFGDKTK